MYTVGNTHSQKYMDLHKTKLFLSSDLRAEALGFYLPISIALLERHQWIDGQLENNPLIKGGRGRCNVSI